MNKKLIVYVYKSIVVKITTLLDCLFSFFVLVIVEHHESLEQKVKVRDCYNNCQNKTAKYLLKKVKKKVNENLVIEIFIFEVFRNLGKVRSLERVLNGFVAERERSSYSCDYVEYRN